MARALSDIEAATGVTLDDSTYEGVPSVNVLEPSTIEALRQLPRVDQHVALRHLLAERAHPAIDAFMDAVERGGPPDVGHGRRARAGARSALADGGERGRSAGAAARRG